MLALPEVCAWLLESGCDVNRYCFFGTPLHCGLLELNAFSGSSYDPEAEAEYLFKPAPGEIHQRTMTTLLQAGADPNCHFRTSKGRLSPLFLNLSEFRYKSTNELLEKGAKLDERCMTLVEEFVNDDEEDMEVLSEIIAHTSDDHVQPEHYGRLWEVALKLGKSAIPRLAMTGTPQNEDRLLQPIKSEHSLRTAAEFGQIKIVKQLIEEHNLDLKAAEEGTGYTALHYAVMNDHLEATKLLLAHGAQSCEMDLAGRTAIHHSAAGIGLSCLEFFLQGNVEVALTDTEGLSVWHMAAMNRNEQALALLLKHCIPIPKLSDIKAENGMTPL